MKAAILTSCTCISSALLLLITTGCATSENGVGGAESPYAAWPAATSNPDVSAPPTPPPPGVSSTDLNVAAEISRLLRHSGRMSSAARNVLATVDRGVVTLRGSVSTTQDQDEIEQRIRDLPGVDYIDDKLVVDGYR